MDCPQCDDTLVTYELDGREAFVCERCGYVGMETSHGGQPVEIESWDEALERFHRDQITRTDGDGDDDDTGE